MLRALAASAPVLIAIDDVQWLDSASTDALAFALRRLANEPIRLLGSVRTFSALAPYADSTGGAVDALPAALPAGSVESMVLPPLRGGELGALIESRLSLVLPAPMLHELHERTGGNPFWALEVARAVVAAGAAGGLPVPESLATSVDRRLRGLPAAARTALLVVAALSHPSVALASRALDGQVDDGGAHAGNALTATEQRVAELVASGRTNREVATELFTSVRTVEGHLAAVYRKLGVRSRPALAHHLTTAATSGDR